MPAAQPALAIKMGILLATFLCSLVIISALEVLEAIILL